MIQKCPVTPDDRSFLFLLYCSTRQAEVKAYGWDDMMREQFLHMQWNAQQHSYAMQFPKAEQSILLQKNKKAGRMIVNRQKEKLTIILIDISLLPEFQNRGIGTSLIRELQAEAEEEKSILSLSVLPASPALRLYERLGFRALESDGYHIRMEWRGAI
ncbi:GNAT family N-acetyltransferase [Paenibacillus lautus]|jgi:ribosomal protein S18 acetylase RimI-like enzyme|uniref:GNAT family N-acetyltransferase n=1 Tax=Paenibacillus lautus TaxID=1401 RepID=A0A385TRG3_PAELA|nr:GNAT family N-acetyltransferase [Paenibacillus lautus]AYB46133.1 GNAT family N-acetyltransferase [Paenibacillus lautus]MCI1774024.1 GNAT family N-acetyltransferase [Paenibacillus lautus]VTR54355.1 ribosomal-protein-alanine acetyltransferase [Actinobacillus pleuropneumoniae]